MSMHIDLFKQIVRDKVAHPQFLSLRGSPVHADARELINLFFARMGDPDRKFVHEFQGPGFHSHLFELACFAYLEEAGFVATRTFSSPDFLVSKNGIEIALECTTANPKGGRDTDISVAGMENWSEEMLIEKVEIEFPRRVVRLLDAKLKKKYHLRPQCANKPFVLVIAPFHEAGSVLYSDESLIETFFGGPSGAEQGAEPFFQRTDAKHVSAILYCNAFQVSKFLRMSTDFQNFPNLKAVRGGKCYVDHTESEYAFSDFRFRMGDPSISKETWAEGITLFENPFAEIPLPAGILPCTSTISLKEGYVYRDVHGFHPLASYMVMSGNSDSANR